MKKKQTESVSRREFLQGAAAAGVGAAVAVSLPGVAAAATHDTKVAAATTRDKGYEETSHVRQYYETLSN